MYHGPVFNTTSGIARSLLFVGLSVLYLIGWDGAVDGGPHGVSSWVARAELQVTDRYTGHSVYESEEYV